MKHPGMAAIQPTIAEDLRFLHPPWSWLRLWQTWVVIAVVLAVLFLFSRAVWRAWARAAARAARLAPCRDALAALRDALDRWDGARPDAFALELSAILRTFMERMGAGACSKFTAAEVTALLPGWELLADGDRAWLASTVTRCEPTKWAGRPMTRAEAERLVIEGAAAVQGITDRREARIASAGKTPLRGATS
jgi:hypothetical protein